MRRLAFVLVLLIAGWTATHAQGPAERAHASSAFEIALPSTFQTGSEATVAPNRSVQVFTDPESARSVVLGTVRGMNPFMRFLYARGYGLRASEPQSTFRRVSPSVLPAASGLLRSATSAFAYTGSSGTHAGVVVRGCQGDVCYQVNASGPVQADDPSGLRYAELLAGLEAKR